MIRIENLRKAYGQFLAVNGITFEVKRGEILGFLGPNGAGKSTTMKVITGYYPPTEGTVTIDGHDVTSESLVTRSMIGYLPESNPLYTELTVSEYLHHIAELREIPVEQRNERIQRMVEVTGLTDRLNQPIGELSKGYRQRVGLAQAMIHDPEILILDEPTIGLDPNQIVEIRSLIKQIGKEKTVILSTHILPEVQATCDRVVIISNGKIVADGTTDQLLQSNRGEPVIDLLVRGKGADNVSAWEAVDGVRVAEVRESSETDAVNLRLTAEAKADPREALFKLAVKNKWVLLGMSLEVQSLESIFAQLTMGEPVQDQEPEAQEVSA